MEARDGTRSALALTGPGPRRLQPEHGDALPWVWPAALSVTSVARAQLPPGLLFVAVSWHQPVSGRALFNSRGRCVLAQQSGPARKCAGACCLALEVEWRGGSLSR